jgi:hypothetical protein
MYINLFIVHAAVPSSYATLPWRERRADGLTGNHELDADKHEHSGQQLPAPSSCPIHREIHGAPPRDQLPYLPSGHTGFLPPAPARHAQMPVKIIDNHQT